MSFSQSEAVPFAEIRLAFFRESPRKKNCLTWYFFLYFLAQPLFMRLSEGLFFENIFKKHLRNFEIERKSCAIASRPLKRPLAIQRKFIFHANFKNREFIFHAMFHGIKMG